MIRFGDFCILTAERLVKAGDKTISLPPKEFDLLVKLARNEHIVLKREQLLESVWAMNTMEIPGPWIHISNRCGSILASTGG